MMLLKFYTSGFIVSLLFSNSTQSAPFFGTKLRRYKVVHEAVEVFRTRPEVPYKWVIRKFNKTTPVMDIDFQILDPIVNKFQVWIEGYERLGMEHIYIKSAVSLVTSYCEFLIGKFGFNRGLKDYGNVPTKCPLKPGNYTVRNYVIDEKYLPAFIPGIFWRLDFYMGFPGAILSSNETGKLSYYCKIVYI